MVSLRKIVKKAIPTGVFEKIEPIGHLAESVIMNVRYGFPARKLRVIGVTGTNGKTTTSFFIHRMLHESGHKVGLMTTVANGIGAEIKTQSVHITTADAGTMQRRLRDYVDAGVEWVVIETSSHALSQHRVWGIPYEIAVMTNITHEHLDYHKTFERYTEAKRRLFKLANRHGLKFGVVNADDPQAKLFVDTVDNSTTYGINGGQLLASNISLESDGSKYTARIENDTYNMKLSVPGDFNVSNSLAAIAVGRKLGLTKKQIERGVASLTTVEGRMNRIDEGQAFTVIVDFASTPDAFERVMKSVRASTAGKLIVVFGSAGRRDESKRPIQGGIAATYADVVVITEEDDRDVDGELIQNEIAAGALKNGKQLGKDVFKYANRKDAIQFAVEQASGKGDTVLLLGKGHERTIERADGEHAWNESDVTRDALRRLSSKRNA